MQQADVPPLALTVNELADDVLSARAKNLPHSGQQDVKILDTVQLIIPHCYFQLLQWMGQTVGQHVQYLLLGDCESVSHDTSAWFGASPAAGTALHRQRTTLGTNDYQRVAAAVRTGHRNLLVMQNTVGHPRYEPEGVLGQVTAILPLVWGGVDAALSLRKCVWHHIQVAR
jgi:hypothetical protein